MGSPQSLIFFFYANLEMLWNCCVPNINQKKSLIIYVHNIFTKNPRSQLGVCKNWLALSKLPETIETALKKNLPTKLNVASGG